VDILVWSAARRLARLVGLLVAVVGLETVHDALIHRGSSFAEICTASSAVVALVAFVVLARTRRFFADSAAHSEPAAPLVVSYRDNARPPPDDGREARRGRATRDAAGALAAFVAAGALILVAAASR
jgi:hypothetical protein